MGGIGATEILLIVLVAMLLFGAGRIADIGKGLGEGIRNFKKGLRDDSARGDNALGEAESGKPFAELDQGRSAGASAPKPVEVEAKIESKKSDE
jgi:sec-independent protein translocase protein TatA